MEHTPSPKFPNPLVHQIAGWTLLLCFFGLTTTYGGYRIVFSAPFTFMSAGELKLWLAGAFFLFPGCCLLGFGYHTILERWIKLLRKQLDDLTPTQRRTGLLLVTILAIVGARLSNALILHGYPITDDEYAAKFGGELLAKGKLFVTPNFPLVTIPYLFLFIKGNSVAGMDWTGTQLAWAISDLTRSGNWVFAISAAIPVGSLALILHKRLGIAWAAFGSLLFLMSPMAWMLSMTTHGHLHSRAFLALALAAFVLASDAPSPKRWFFLGLFLGLAFICRPYETAFMGTPCLLVLFAERRRNNGKKALPEIAAVLFGGLLPLIGFCVHSWLVTDGLLPPRQAAGAIAAPILESSLWIRFGSNCSFNLFLLAVFFAGPLGIVLISAGLSMNGLTKTLGLSVLSVLLLGLFHDNYGIHIVGPIHYSECVIPLTVIAVHGMARLTRSARNLGLNPFIPVSIATVWITLGLGIFNAFQGEAMYRQAQVQEKVYEKLEMALPANAGRKSVILAPRFATIRDLLPGYSATGSWVFEWRRPKPDFSDDVLILHDVEGNQEAILKAFPDRAVFRMIPTKDGNLFRLSPIEESKN